MWAVYYKFGGSNVSSPNSKYSQNKKKYFRILEEKDRKTAELREKGK
jgi:hypothetical protein